MYINCHTHYSLRYGTFSEKELMQMAIDNGVKEIALTDINNTSACLNFVRLAPRFGIRPVVGIDFRNGNQKKYVAIAKNNEGFLELNNHLSEHKQQEIPFPDVAPPFENAFVIYHFSQMNEQAAIALRNHEYIGVNVDDLRRLLLSPLYRYRHKLVLLQPVSFRNQRDYNTHRLLRAIDNNVLLSKLPPEEQGERWELMYPLDRLEQLFDQHPFILSNTRALWEECNIHFDFSANRKPQNLSTYTGSREKDIEMMEQLCEEGLQYRYEGKVSDAVRQRLEKELNLIKKMNFVSYFLINWDIVNYARSKNYFYVGRGSGANSIVAYLLRITDVDPIELDLYFERFINLYRANPPDFDIDFSWRDRDDVTRYIFERFEHTALLATYNTFQRKGAIREIGKVLGLPNHEIEAVISGEFPGGQPDEMAMLTLKYSKQIFGMPNHLSVHAGGILIADKPIHYFSATDLPPKGFPTTHFDMHIAEDVGLYKFDILGQRGLAKIKEAIAIIAKNRPEAELPDIHKVNAFIKDEKVNRLVKQAKCLGCFYVESPAMRMLLKKLEVDNYLGLVAASSIIRPGVSNSGMMREYILRHKDRSRLKDAHPVFLDIMPETYGVMVYQEDVIKVAHYFAGLTLGEADVLRRGMSGKFRSREEFQKVRQKFIDNCREKGYEETLIRDVWRQVESFAGYAFAKGHSASYAVESYQSLYLKTYYPLEFMVAVLNNGGGFYRPETYIHEIRMLGGEVYLPCVNTSTAQTVIRGKEIYLGFHFLKDIESYGIEMLLESRKREGSFKSLEDFMERVPLGIEQLAILIRIEAFRFTGIPKRKLLWEAHFKCKSYSAVPAQTQLFKLLTKQYSLPELNASKGEHIFDQLELLGFSMHNPFYLLKDPIQSPLTASDLGAHLNKTVTIYGYLVSVKNTKTRNGKLMNFGTFLDLDGHFIDTTHFPIVAANYPFRGKGVYAIKGKVVEEFGFYSLEVMTMAKQAYMTDPRYTEEHQEAEEFKQLELPQPSIAV